MTKTVYTSSYQDSMSLRMKARYSGFITGFTGLISAHAKCYFLFETIETDDPLDREGLRGYNDIIEQYGFLATR